jgi:hypothetical protein
MADGNAAAVVRMLEAMSPEERRSFLVMQGVPEEMVDQELAQLGLSGGPSTTSLWKVSNTTGVRMAGCYCQGERTACHGSGLAFGMPAGCRDNAHTQ